MTVNFAKARPCSAEQLRRIAGGARRTLRIRAPAELVEATVRSLLGRGAEVRL